MLKDLMELNTIFLISTLTLRTLFRKYTLETAIKLTNEEILNIINNPPTEEL